MAEHIELYVQPLYYNRCMRNFLYKSIDFYIEMCILKVSSKRLLTIRIGGEAYGNIYIWKTV